MAAGVAGSHAGVAPAGTETEGLALPDRLRPAHLGELDAIAHAAVDTVDDVAVLVQLDARPPVDGEVRGMILLYGPEQQLLVPGAALDATAIVFVFEHHGHRGPEEAGHLAVEPGARGGLHQDAVIAQRDASRQGIVDDGEVQAGAVMTGKVIGNHQLRMLEVLAIDVDDALLRLEAPRDMVARGGHLGVPLAPHPKVSDVDERHVGVTVIAPCHLAHEMLYGREEDSVVILRLLVMVHLMVAGTGLEHPLRRARERPVLGGGDAQGHLLAHADPSLGGRVEPFPVELPFLRFDEGPGQAQIDGRETGEIVEHILRLELRTIVGGDVRIEVHRPSHVGIHQGTPVVGGDECLFLCHRGGGHQPGAGEAEKCVCRFHVRVCLLYGRA